MSHTQDGSELLTGPGAGGLLRSAVGNSGGVLHSWQLDHVDHRPGRSTKALYRTMVSWPELDGPQAPAREELFGASAHIGEREKNLYVAEQTLVMTDGDINVRVWRYPHDPWLPMLPQVCYPDIVGRTLHDLGVSLGPDPSAPIAIDVVSYRPGRRAVLRASQGDTAVYLKVMQPHRSGEIVDRHQRLLAAGVPVPEVIAHHQGLVVLRELPGRPLARAVIDEGVQACRAEDLVALLDRLPASMYPLPLRPPWTDSVEFYAGIVSSAVPSLGPRLDSLVRAIREGLAALEQRMDMRPHDVVHGDFYEAQVFVQDGRVVGLLDIDTVGPGRRADDLACLLAHLSVLADYGNAGRIDRAMQERVEDAIRTWHAALEDRVDPTELALRSAGVVLSLATGPHRQQEAAWEAATEAIVRVAEEWVAHARRAERARHERQAATQNIAALNGASQNGVGQNGPVTGTPPVQDIPPTQGPTGVRAVPAMGAPTGQHSAPTGQHAIPAGYRAPSRPSIAPQPGSSAPVQQSAPPQRSAPSQAGPLHSAPPQSAHQQHAPQQGAPQQPAPQQPAPQQPAPQPSAPQHSAPQHPAPPQSAGPYSAPPQSQSAQPPQAIPPQQSLPQPPVASQQPQAMQAPLQQQAPPQPAQASQDLPATSESSWSPGDDSPTQERRISSIQPH
ncbi:phosphotransferase [Brachybacterium aquaticum]|uniref:Aminoglycoside phosphotransferase (APT) family kinase protein n=1 Tax=Brachybacterium aquaticum TaxID=1432564 RepID=A0A841ABI5_9MICO|nr:phosphotransferase [Brachybacterium aquaticum]MBB5832196.1 aminoglycoside phosphotransferase (APT) family kinase protein [Brachybacterium aquaticum]